MAAPLIPHDTHRVAAHLLGGVGETGVGNLVHDQAAGPLQGVHKRLGGAAGGLHNADLFLCDGLEKALDGAVGLGIRQEGEVDAEGFVCEGFQQLNVLLKGLRRVIGGHVDGAQAPGVGDRGGQLGLGEPLHGALNDGILNAEQVGDARFHGASSWME